MLRFARQTPPPVNIQLTALIDMVFLLLIYFLLTSNFIEQDTLPIALPEAETREALVQPHLVVAIDRAGLCYVDEAPISEAALAHYLALALAASPEREVLVKADRRVVYERVVRVMDLAKRQGARKLLLAIEAK